MNDFKTILTLGAGRILLGFAVGTYSWAADPDPPPPLGKLYEVGGHKMPLYATGSATNGPSVVLEAGAGAFSIDWYLVQQEVARFAAVCSYDRAGHAKPLVVLARKSDEKALMEGRESFQNLS